jgi:hypothetical protein
MGLGSIGINQRGPRGSQRGMHPAGCFRQTLEFAVRPARPDYQNARRASRLPDAATPNSQRASGISRRWAKQSHGALAAERPARPPRWTRSRWAPRIAAASGRPRSLTAAVARRHGRVPGRRLGARFFDKLLVEAFSVGATQIDGGGELKAEVEGAPRGEGHRPLSPAAALARTERPRQAHARQPVPRVRTVVDPPAGSRPTETAPIGHTTRLGQRRPRQHWITHQRRALASPVPAHALAFARPHN